MTLFTQKKRDFMISLIRFSNAAANYDYIFFTTVWLYSPVHNCMPKWRKGIHADKL